MSQISAELGNSSQCSCNCHDTGFKILLRPNQAKPCCDCCPLHNARFGYPRSNPPKCTCEKYKMEIKNTGLLERIIELEAMKYDYYNVIKINADLCVRLDNLEKSFKEIERFQDITHEQYQYNIKNKKRHKGSKVEFTFLNYAVEDLIAELISFQGRLSEISKAQSE